MGDGGRRETVRVRVPGEGNYIGGIGLGLL
jgi:hypothetical protein